SGLEPSARGGRVHDGLEAARVAQREIREDLAVEADVRRLEAVHQLAVAQAEIARRRVDADDPQLAEVALLLAAVPPRVAPAVAHLLDRVAVDAAARRVVALGVLESPVAAPARLEPTLRPRHGSAPSDPEKALDVLLVGVVDHVVLAQAAQAA